MKTRAVAFALSLVMVQAAAAENGDSLAPQPSAAPQRDVSAEEKLQRARTRLVELRAQRDAALAARAARGEPAVGLDSRRRGVLPEDPIRADAAMPAREKAEAHMPPPREKSEKQ